MSLTGNLEDLPLLDILQIVSFSKKTGFLAIHTAIGDGAIVFREGLVISSFTWDSLPMDPRAESLPEDKRHRIIRSRIEIALAQLIRLREGQFSFSLCEEIPGRVGTRDISQEILGAGINPQELLLDLARGLDEDRRDSSAALEASFAEPAEDAFEDSDPGADSAIAAFVQDADIRHQEPAPGEMTMPIPTLPVAPASNPIRTLLLVDDEDDIRGVLKERFALAGYAVVEAEDPDSAVKKASQLGKAGTEFLLVTDLGMPTSGGSSFQGGFEVVKRLLKMNLQPPVLMMTERFGEAVQARARQMGISSFVFKPGLSKLDPRQFEADLSAFAAKILEDILPKLGRAPMREAARKAEPSGPGLPPPAASSEEVSQQFAALQRRLQELRRPGDATQISQIVMRVAREFFERGILFLVKNEEIRGLGAFGLAPAAENLSLLVRDITMPLSEPSVFLDVVVRRQSYSGPLPDGRWARHLIGKIGRFKSTSVALFPLVAHRETIAVVFGDNAETGREFGRLDAFEVFLDQAGIALENAFLQRKILTLQQKG
jgi:CheY-like chemotaxis protein